MSVRRCWPNSANDEEGKAPWARSRRFPTPENQIFEELEELTKAAQEGAFIAFAYVFQDQDGGYTCNWLGDVDEPSMRTALMDLRRKIRNGE
jgi:hypothetical protein